MKIFLVYYVKRINESNNFSAKYMTLSLSLYQWTLSCVCVMHDASVNLGLTMPASFCLLLHKRADELNLKFRFNTYSQSLQKSIFRSAYHLENITWCGGIEDM